MQGGGRGHPTRHTAGRGDHRVSARRRAPDGICSRHSAGASRGLAGAAATTRFVYIRRHVQAERGAELDRHPFLEYVERIIIPHALDEAVGALASHLARKAEWVGPIARQPKPASPFPRGVDDTFQLTSTAGGGGFGASTDRFFDLVEQVGRSLGTSIKGLAHLVVLGPNYDNPARAARLGAVAGVTVRQHDSALVDRLAEADLVLAEGGYNTVNEICLAGAAAVFVPAPRGFDDQHQRVAALAHRGVGLVVEPDETLTGAVQRIISLATDPQRLAAMRAAHVPIALGNDRAADLIADVARRR